MKKKSKSKVVAAPVKPTHVAVLMPIDMSVNEIAVMAESVNCNASLDIDRPYMQVVLKRRKVYTLEGETK